MYNIGDLVYVYLNDLTISLPNMSKLLYSRFGYITDINNIVDGEDNVTPSYTVKTRSNSTLIVDGTKGFKLCNMTELKAILDDVKENNLMSNTTYNDMLSMIALHKTNK